MKFAYRFVQDQSGATSIECAAIAGFLSIVVVTAVFCLSPVMKGKFSSVLPAFH